MLANAAVEGTRAALAKLLAKEGFSNLEPLGCKTLANAAKRIDGSSGIERFYALLDFAGECMTKTERSELRKAIESRRIGRRQGKAKFGALFPFIEGVTETGSAGSMMRFLEALREQNKCHTYRREMFFAMCSALRIIGSRPEQNLVDAIADVQIRIRHGGRRFWEMQRG